VQNQLVDVYKRVCAYFQSQLRASNFVLIIALIVGSKGNMRTQLHKGCRVVNSSQQLEFVGPDQSDALPVSHIIASMDLSHVLHKSRGTYHDHTGAQ
jgi:hypothetical protein